MPQARPARKPPWKPVLRSVLPLWVLAFLVLKLTGAVTWSWWWVMAPWWVTALLALLIAGGVALVFALARWVVLAGAWLGFRRLPELILADPATRARIEAERPVHPAEPSEVPEIPGPAQLTAHEAGA